jgi:hypothetical protein
LMWSVWAVAAEAEEATRVKQRAREQSMAAEIQRQREEIKREQENPIVDGAVAGAVKKKGWFS